MDDPLLRWVNQDVILNTATAICTIAATGNASKEASLAEANREGVTINRSID